MTEARFLTVREFAALVRAPESTVRALAARGGLPGAHRLGRFLRVDLEAYLAASRCAPPAPAPGRRAPPADFLARVAEGLG